MKNYVEGKDYVFLQKGAHAHFDYVIQIRFEPQNDEEPFYTWELGVINLDIVKNQKSVGNLVEDFLSNYPNKPSENYRTSLMKYTQLMIDEDKE